MTLIGRGGFLIAVVGVASLSRGEAPPQPAALDPFQNGVALTADADAGLPGGLFSPTSGAPCHIVIPVGRSELERPERLDGLLDAAAATGLGSVAFLSDEGLAPQELAAAPWIEQVTALARRAGARIGAWQLLATPAARHDAATYAFLLKQIAVALRAAGSEVRIVSGSLREQDIGWAEALFAADAAPYVDVLAAEGPAALPAVVALRDRLAPRAAVWVVAAPIDPGAPFESATRTYFESIAAGAEWVGFGTAPAAAAAGLGPWLSDLRSVVPPSMELASPAALPFDPERTTLAGTSRMHTVAFFDTERREGLVAYRAEPAPADGLLRITLRTSTAGLWLLDPRGGTTTLAEDLLAPGTIVELPVRDDLLVLRWRLAAEALPVHETVGVGAPDELTAEEIIARERTLRTAQNARLDHYEAQATIAIHYRIASLGESVDVVTENRLYVHGGNQDYEQLELYVDGARWRGKTPPYLPFLQPEKVKEVPLDIALDEGYRYTLLGRKEVDGRDCYVIAFEPRTEERSLYRGSVSIDAELFTRVRMEGVQNGLAAPLRSNHVTYTFGPVDSATGPFWLPTEIAGQMVFEVLGQNLVVERRATYHEFAINQAGFAARIDQAYAAGRPLFRETERGYYRLSADGGAVELTDASTPRNVFLVFGTTADIDGGGLGLPFAGINFFDFDYKGSGHQVDLAWAGPFADLSWTDPQLGRARPGRRPWSLTFEGNFNALRHRARSAGAQGVDDAVALEQLTEWVRGAVAIPMGPFAKWTVEARATYLGFARRSSTDPAFVVPQTTLEGRLLARLEYDRSGYVVAGWGEVARRDRWRRWGLPATPFDPDERDYTRLGLQLIKTLYLRGHSKLGLELAGYEGRGLDRFSRFELGEFQTARVHGFNSAGIHFDRGMRASATQSFPLGTALRMDVDLETAWFTSREDFGPGYERVTGGGVKFVFSGPWSTLVTLRASHGLASTIGGTGKGGDLRLVFFKTFDRWGRRKARAD